MANRITLSRLPLLLVVVFLLYSPSLTARWLSILLLVVLIGLDTLDGVVARARGEESLRGSVLDVMVDRVVELVLWICYADLRLAPVAIPIIYVMRGTIVDSLRGLAVRRGAAPLKAARTAVGLWLMGSPFMRTGYAAVKLVSFAGLALTHALSAYADQTGTGAEWVELGKSVFGITSWVSVFFCLMRGLPVILEAVALPPDASASEQDQARPESWP